MKKRRSRNLRECSKGCLFTQAEVAQILGVTRACVADIERRAMRKLRQSAAARELFELLLTEATNAGQMRILRTGQDSPIAGQGLDVSALRMQDVEPD